jgi:hypothetical protein
MKYNPNKDNNRSPHHQMAECCLPSTYTYHLIYRLFPKLGLYRHSLYFHITLVYGCTCIKEHCYWLIRVKHLGVADVAPRVADAPDL